jgi:hypothetical protein
MWMVTSPATHSSVIGSKRDGPGRCLGEAQLGRLRGERRLGCHGVLGEAAHQREIVAVHLVTGSEASDALAHGLDPPGDVRSERPMCGRAEPAETRVRRRTAEALPVAEIDRRGRNPDEHLSGGARWDRHLLHA